MKTIVRFAALLAVALAAPPNPEEKSTTTPVTVIEQFHEIRPDGQSHGFVLSNGIKKVEHVQKVQEEVEVDGKLVLKNVTHVWGTSEHVAPEGHTILLKYNSSDILGFHAEGAHLPVAPINPHVAKA